MPNLCWDRVLVYFLWFSKLATVRYTEATLIDYSNIVFFVQHSRKHISKGGRMHVAPDPTVRWNPKRSFWEVECLDVGTQQQPSISDAPWDGLIVIISPTKGNRAKYMKIIKCWWISIGKVWNYQFRNFSKSDYLGCIPTLTTVCRLPGRFLFCFVECHFYKNTWLWVFSFIEMTRKRYQQI